MRSLAKILLLLFVTMGLAFAKSSNNNLHSLYMPAGNSILGNPNGQITLVEFFDYNCGYCRMMYPNLQQLVKDDNSLRVVFREYPVLSGRSTLPAEAALAAQKQGKYIQLHDAMMSAMMPLSQGEIVKLAQQVGINTTQLLKDMQSSSVSAQLQNNMTVGQNMNIQGVPTFIVVRTSPPSKQQPDVVTGPSISQLKSLIAQAKNT
jgi:protein-disulfide isomerase